MMKSELLFYYEAKNCNPNGDPLEEDRPRSDGSHIIVSDVRLKRTIRDYWDLKQKENSRTYFMPKRSDNGELETRDDAYNHIRKIVKEKLGNGPEAELDKKTVEEIFRQFVDMRLFGAVFSLDKDKSAKSSHHTGAIQFALGRSKHMVEIKQLKGTTVMPSGEGKDQGTFTNRFVVPYALIEFYGIVNPHNYPKIFKGDELEQKFNDDVNYLCEGFWEGTSNLLTRSKIGHRPAIIIKVNYNDDRHIGILSDFVELQPVEKNNRLTGEKEIRSSNDYRLDFQSLLGKLKDAHEKGMLNEVELKFNDPFKELGEDFKAALKKIGITNKEITLDQNRENGAN